MCGRAIAKMTGPVRLVVAACLIVALGARAAALGTFVDAIMYVASWVTILHLGVGAFLFVRVAASSPAHRFLEACDVCCAVAMVWAFTRPALWCIALSMLMAGAGVRYYLIYKADSRPAVRAYAFAKLQGELPSIPIMALMALLFRNVPSDGMEALCLATIALLGTTGFAIWMAVRRIYPRLLAAL